MYKATSTSLDDPDDNGKTKVFRVNCPGGTDPTPPGEENPDEEDPDEVDGRDRDKDDDDKKDKDKKDKDRDDDDGPPAVGGVRTGGGALQADTAVPAAALLLLLGAVTAGVTYRRQRA